MTDEIDNKRADLAVRLYKLTRDRKIRWSTDNFEGDLQATIGGANVSLSHTSDDEGTPFEVIRLERRDGGATQVFTDGNISDVRLSIPNFESYWHLMRTTREMAELQSSGVEETLDDVLRALSEIEDDKSKKSIFDTDLDDDVPF